MTTGTEEPSGRIARADAARRERLREQRALLRPLGWALIAVVAVTTETTSPDARRASTCMPFRGR